MTDFHDHARNLRPLACGTTITYVDGQMVDDKWHPIAIAHHDWIGGVLDTLQRVRNLHRPGHPVYTHGHGADFEDLCPDCRGKAGVHECGCWGDYDRDIYCATCRDEKGRHAVWPTATDRLIYPEDEL